MSELRATGRQNKGVLSKLPVHVFCSLAEGTEKWSEHHGKKTVTFRRGVLLVNRARAEHDSKFDNYIDNGPVAVSYYKLVQSLLGHARLAKEAGATELFSVLAHLYRHLTTLKDDACNQE